MRVWLCLALTGVLCACGKPGDAPAAAAVSSVPAAASAAVAATAGPPVTVTTAVATRRDLPVILDATGTVVAVTSVDVRSQVSSVVKQVLVRDGQFVRSGQPLFLLDARADEANVAKLQAQTARDEAALADALRQLARNRDLLAQNFISPSVVDTSQAAVDAQRAAVAADRAAVQAAQVPLGYARITAPVGGRVGTVTVSVGSAVQANQTPLVTITQLDPIDVSFPVPQRHLAGMLEALRGGGAPVAARLPDDAASAPALTGRLDFVDSAIDAGSGTVKVKARFANEANRLWPGAFVRVALTVRTIKDAVVLPMAAVVQGQRGSIVFVVEDGKAQSRSIEVLATQGEDAAVTGLKPGERIVLDGRQNLRTGAAVVERSREGAGGATRGASAAAPSASATMKARVAP
jgi:RND family efflux transporter MFP subunit